MSNQQVEAAPTQPKVENPRVKAMKDFYRRLKKNVPALIGFYTILILVIFSFIGPWMLSADPSDTDVINKFAGPSAEHWFGTDHLGRDIFTRIVHGMKLTLGIGFASVFMGAAMGIPIGIIAGYYGGKIDAVIMRLIDILLAFPGILLALAIVSILGGNLINVTIAVAIYAIPGFARIIRGSTLAAKNLEYVDAIKALGAGDGRIIFKHILPNVLSPVIVNATLYIATAILTAAGLSFLGMGAQPPRPEWGAMLNDGRSYMRDAGHIAFFPGMAIVIVVLAFNIFGDGLRDALDPKMKK
ncbi:ABC transporter permease [Alkalibacillus salilacus]|uniref:Peptide/nickel transport system permease protein n=1 Tax=Alkalibacillus salilacus TaxID=284582 RepID=A0ABT9VB00_9BACI|nr:ABC transporter permease subunit [Alkalibacillus salilacus]MDQ0158090.1 peptide/nickel transport system permease protein [Alkalibacillus salilacus]